MKKYINIEDMTNQNCSNVLNIIQKNGSLSRKQITEKTGLSWGGMTKIVNKLSENGYITEKKQEPTSKSGRIPSLISVNDQRNFVIGLDINKTGLKAIVMNLSGDILKKYASPVMMKSKDEMLYEIIAFTDNIFCDFEQGQIIAIGIAMQGIVDSKNGISIKFPGVDDWCNVPIEEILNEKFNVNVFVEHDPDCLLYPHIEGKRENTILLRVDKSIGMAVSINGKILKDSGILEIAHNIVIPNGKKCACGLCGCVEAYVSPCLENGSPNGTAIGEFISALSIVIKNMSNIFNADKIILTGDLINHKKLFETDLFQELKKLNCNTEFVFSTNEDYAVLGAALIAIQKSIQSCIVT